MKSRDTIWLAYRALSQHKARTALTILMVVIGIAAIVALVSLTAGEQASVQKSLDALGPTAIFVTSTGQGGFTPAEFAMVSALPNVSSAIPIIEESATLEINGESTSVTLVGVSSSNLSSIISSVGLYSGTLYPNNQTGLAVIGNSVAFSSSGDQQFNLGSSLPLTIRGSSGSETVYLATDGIVNTFGASTFLSVDDSIFISMSEAQSLFPSAGYTTIYVKANTIGEVDALSTTLKDAFGDNAEVTTAQQLASTTSSILSGTTSLLLIVAAISLLVAAIGIMNIMFVSVLERTKEIGILKTIGFNSRNILVTFLLEALIIGVIGGVLGIGAGVGTAQAAHILTTTTNSTTASPSSEISTTSFKFNSTSFPGGDFAGSGGSGTTVTRAPSGGGGAFSGGPPSGAFTGSFIFSSGAANSFTGIGSAVLSASTASSSSISAYSPVITPELIVLALFVAIVVSALAGVYPAIKAARMQPIDAIRHE